MSVAEVALDIFYQQRRLEAPQKWAYLARKYVDEEFVKHMKHIAAKCVSGTKQHLAPTKLLRW